MGAGSDRYRRKNRLRSRSLRSQNLILQIITEPESKHRMIYAPMSGVGGIVYDKDAVYIELGHGAEAQRAKKVFGSTYSWSGESLPGQSTMSVI